MGQKKVFVSWDIPSIGIELLKNAGMQVDVWKGSAPLTQDELISAVVGCDALLSQSTDKLNETFFSQCKHLDVISQFSVGYDNIDLQQAAICGIPLGNAPGAMTEATADIAFGLMLAASRKFFYMHKQILRGEWKQNPPQAFLGQDLRDKTLGIFGMGKIGREMARLCQSAFGMQIIYHNRKPLGTHEESGLHARYVDFDELLSQSDVLSVHASLSDSTREIFNLEAFRKMKASTIFINTSRGGLVKESDLIIALQEGIIWGAGLDVSMPEPMSSENPLLNMENVCILPHIGSATVGARNNMSRMAAENILSFYQKGTVSYPIGI